METDFSTWTKESVDNLIQCVDISNDEKIKKMEDYIKWIVVNLDKLNLNSYPLINLLVGYCGMVENKSTHELKEMMNRSYPDEIANQVVQMTNLEILSSISLITFVYNLLNSLV
jgi:hypothetical protein